MSRSSQSFTPKRMRLTPARDVEAQWRLLVCLAEDALDMRSAWILALRPSPCSSASLSAAKRSDARSERQVVDEWLNETGWAPVSSND